MPNTKHPLFHPKLDAIGYGFLIPVFFVTSGLTFNLSVLFSSASTLLRVPLFLLAQCSRMSWLPVTWCSTAS
jgi:Kef-type K+ transport system membrane component KefB